MGAAIMVCDDDPNYSDMVSDLLESEGYTMSRCADVFQLTEAVGKTPPADLYILDMEMPGGGGPAAAKLLREHPATAGKPILISSGMAAIEQAGWFQAYKRMRFLQKPVQRDALLAIVAAALREK